MVIAPDPLCRWRAGGRYDLLDENWRTVWESNGQLEGPEVSIGTRVFDAGQPFDLGDPTFRRQALIWYVLRTAIDRLEDEDPWFAMNGKIAAIYPAHVVSDLVDPSQSYANGLTRMVYLNQGQPDTHWHPGVVLHEFMHLWKYDHNTGTTNWLGALCSGRGDLQADLSTHGYRENLNVAFHEGCAQGLSSDCPEPLMHFVQRPRELSLRPLVPGRPQCPTHSTRRRSTRPTRWTAPSVRSLSTASASRP